MRRLDGRRVRCSPREGGSGGRRNTPMTATHSALLTHSPGCVHEGDARSGQAIDDALRAQVNGDPQCLVGGRRRRRRAGIWWW